jgi:Protein of unknown function (DUF3613)
MNRPVLTAFSFAMLTSSALGAAELPTESSGSGTRQWLELQRSGAAASAIRQTVSGSVAENIHERYKKSFKYPIPEFYYQDKGGRKGSGGLVSGQ